LPDFKHGDDAYEEAIAILAGVKRTANHPDLVDRLIGSLKDAKPPDGETR
jgi:hypothetical protein